MLRTYLVVGNPSEIREAIVAQIHSFGDRVLLIDTCSGDVALDFSNAESRLDVIEKVIQKTSGNFDAIISTNNINVNKPIAISANFYGITQFVEGLYDELKNAVSPRISILNFFAETEKYSSNLVESILEKDERSTLRLAQELVEQSSEFSKLIYPSSQMAIQHWIRQTGNSPHWAQSSILINAVTPDSAHEPNKVAELLVWLASPANQIYSGEIWKTNHILERNALPN